MLKVLKSVCLALYMVLNFDDNEYMLMLKPSCIIYKIPVKREGAFVSCEIWHVT
jgi:hypothetical protein